jgi:hypothetical protein
VATICRAPARRNAGAIKPSGAEAPNHTALHRSVTTNDAACRATAAVGSIIECGYRTTRNG